MNKKETKKKQFKLHCPKLATNKIPKQTQWYLRIRKKYVRPLKNRAIHIFAVYVSSLLTAQNTFPFMAFLALLMVLHGSL